MINPKNGEYAPQKIYNRKMVRTMLKSKIYNRDHAGENKKLKHYFNTYRDNFINKEEKVSE